MERKSVKFDGGELFLMNEGMKEEIRGVANVVYLRGEMVRIDLFFNNIFYSSYESLGCMWNSLDGGKSFKISLVEIEEVYGCKKVCKSVKEKVGKLIKKCGKGVKKCGERMKAFGRRVGYWMSEIESVFERYEEFVYEGNSVMIFERKNESEELLVLEAMVCMGKNGEMSIVLYEGEKVYGVFRSMDELKEWLSEYKNVVVYGYRVNVRKLGRIEGIVRNIREKLE